MEISSVNENYILCCLCGVSIPVNPSAMCVNCLSTQVDITIGISKQLTVHWCRNCGRYQRPPWLMVEPESRELMSLLLTKVRGIAKDVRITDVDFVYTEPHSKRLKLKITVQKEVFKDAILRQAFIVEYIVQNLQCPDCARSFTEHVWTAAVQVRQKVVHKRTFLYLEQLLLKHNICQNVTGIKSISGGLDFYWTSLSQANSMLSFLKSVVPIKITESKKLISADLTNNTQKYKYTLYAEIIPICRYDLIYMPKKIGRKFGGTNELLLCYKVTSNLHLIDPNTLKIIDISANVYYRNPFDAILTQSRLVEFDILSVSYDVNQPTITHANRKFSLVEVTVARASDYKEFTILFHMGHIIEAGQIYLGYDLENANSNIPNHVDVSFPFSFFFFFFFH